MLLKFINGYLRNIILYYLINLETKKNVKATSGA